MTAIPLLGAIGAESGEARSASNLRILAAANESYSATFAGRQFTVIPDDAGLANGDCATYLATIACPPPLILGTSPNGGLWGYYLGLSGLCAQVGYPGSCANWDVYKAFNFTGGTASFGSFRLSNADAFNSFVDGRYYSDTFYAPNDVVAMSRSAVYRDAGVDFNSANGLIVFASYCFSPAAMINPLTLAAGGYAAAETYAAGFVSPAVATCAHPDLKTRMIEHNWNHRPPNTSNPAWGAVEPWYFNSSASASTQSIFFDGHIGRILTSKAVADDASAQASSGTGLWHRGTPLGANGYFGQYSADGTKNSHTILTIDGILGRDVLTAQ